MGNSATISLFFTFGVSLKIWDETGLFHRETLPYLEMAKRGHKIKFFTWGDSLDSDYAQKLPGIEIIPLGRFSSKSKILLLFSSFILPFFYFYKTKDTVIKTNQMWGAWTPLLFSALSGAPLLVRVGYELYDFHNKRGNPWIKKSLIYLLSKVTYLWGNAVLTTSLEAKNFIIENFGISNEKVFSHSNYIDLSTFKPLPNNEAMDSKRCVYVGRLDEHKNIDKAISFTASAGLTFDIIGGGELENSLKKLVEKRSFDHVKFLGKIPNHELPSVLKNYDYFILFSKSEGSPKAMLEAMSCGLIPIANDTTGINNIIDHGENGFLIDIYDSQLYWDSPEPQEFKKISSNARLFVENNCSIASLLSLEEKILRSF